MLVEVLLYVHRNRRFIRDGTPGRPPRLLTQLLSSRCVCGDRAFYTDGDGEGFVVTEHFIRMATAKGLW